MIEGNLRNLKNYLFRYKFFTFLISIAYMLCNFFNKKKIIKIKSYKDNWLHYTSLGILPYFHPLFDPDKYIKQNLENFFPFYKVKKKHIIVEFGSGIGTETLFISKKMDNTGIVYAFEPNPKVFKLLKLTIKLNKLKNIKLFNKILFTKKSKLGFDVEINDWLSGNISFKSKKKIKTISLNDFIKDEKIKKINFCKMNIEGSEKYIVHNSDKFFNFFENISIECHDFLNLPEFKTKKKVEIFLIKKGYKILKLKNKDYINYYSKFYVYASKKEFIKKNKNLF